MKLFKKLNSAGFSHHLVLAVVVVGVAIGGTAYLVASHADNVPAATTPNWTQVGSVTIAGPVNNQVITASACTDKVSNVLWKVKGKFTLADAYKTDGGFAWTATITNTGLDPIKNYQVVSKNFNDTTHPQITFQTEVYPPVSSPLTFSYKAGSPSLGTTEAGTIAQNALPQNFAICK